jgi:phage shock protein A
MALLKTLGGWFRAKDRQTADKIEQTNIVEFAKNDLEDMDKDYRTVQENIGHVKARIAQLNDDIKEIGDQITSNTAKAELLLTKTGNTDAEALAQQMCSAVESLEQKLDMNKQALVQQEKLLEQQKTTKATLEQHIQECKNELDLMKTQKEVTDANKTLVHVSSDSSGSSVEKFKERRRKLQEELRVSTAMVEETQDHATSLEEKADKLLGTDKGSALFAKLKAKNAPQATEPAK